MAMKHLLTILLLVAGVAVAGTFDHMTTKQKVDYAKELRDAGLLGASIDALIEAIDDLLNKPVVTAECHRAHCPDCGVLVTNILPFYAPAPMPYFVVTNKPVITFPYIVPTNWPPSGVTLSPTNIAY